MTILRSGGERLLSTWSGPGAMFARHDYKHDDHRLADMLNNDYFGNLAYALKVGDQITLMDCEDQMLVVRVDHTDRPMMKVYLSKVVQLYAMPVVEKREGVQNDPGLRWHWRARNGGGHCVVTAKGEIVAINFPSKEVTEQQISVMYSTSRFVAPIGHEPTKQFVRDTPIYRGE